MSNIEAAKQLYNTCKNMDIDETMQLVSQCRQFGRAGIFFYVK